MCVHWSTLIQKWKCFVSAPQRLRRSVEELVDECGPFAVEQQNIRKHRGNQFMATAIAEPELMLVERLAIFIDAESRLREAPRARQVRTRSDKGNALNIIGWIGDRRFHVRHVLPLFLRMILSMFD